MISTLRTHQETALSMLRQSIGRGGRRVMLQAATGFGKTLLAAAITEGARNKGKRVIFTVPDIVLIDQTLERFAAEGITDIGVMQADHPATDYSRPIQVASVSTLAARFRKNGFLPDGDVVMIDEAHHLTDFHKMWMALEAWAGIPFIGLSATPWTKGLGKHFSELLIAATSQELIDAGFLTPFRVYAPNSPDLKGVRTVAGDYHEGQLAERMSKAELVADVVKTWIEKGEGRPTLCFGVNRAHAKILQQQFVENGVAAAYVDAFTSKAERAEIQRQFATGEVKIVCNVGVLTRGVDWDVRCIILARPTKSEMLFVQMIGRGLRTARGKDDCLILDHSDTHLRLGFVTDIHHEQLDDGKERGPREARVREEALPKKCSSCGYVKPAKVHACPACGFKPMRRSGVEQKHGELVEIRGKKAKREMTSEQKAEFFAQLKGLGQQRGYSSGRIANLFRDRTGVWPNAYMNIPPRQPGAEVISFVKARNIAFAKSQGARP